MNLLIDLFLGIIKFIVAIFTNAWLFIIVFLIIGIVTMRESKGAGGFCILLALLVLVRLVF